VAEAEPDAEADADAETVGSISCNCLVAETAPNNMSRNIDIFAWRRTRRDGCQFLGINVIPLFEELLRVL
jgi:hypothetical protein